jgi:actin related protein 2/3 complex, subunit 2
VQIRCFKDLVKYGAEQVLQREYGSYITATEAGYDFSVLIDLESLPAEKGE